MNATKIETETFNLHIKNNTYPGRGLVIGKMEDNEHWLIIYFIMGRSPNSRNRRFDCKEDRLWTQPVDESKVEDPSLIIYDAMLALPGIQLVSNGDQTKTIYEGLKNGHSFATSLATRHREPDAPNYTPRISGELNVIKNSNNISLSILKANKSNLDLTDRIMYTLANPQPGLGYGLTTYMGDGSPLPSFTGDPLVLPIKGNAKQVLDEYWNALDKDNRVSLAVKQICKDGTLKQLLIKNNF